MHWNEYLMTTFKLDERHNIDDVADLTSIVWTIHTKLRQDANTSGALVTKITDDFLFKVGSVTKKWKELKTSMVSITKLYTFTYGTSVPEKARTGTLGSLLALMVCYRARGNEVRTGTNRITLKKMQGDTLEVPIEQFGLTSSHSVLMAGCTYNPTLQSSMKQSLGPMTVAINLCMQTDKTYQKSWKQTFVSVFKLFPYVNKIADALAGSKKEKDSA